LSTDATVISSDEMCTFQVYI